MFTNLKLSFPALLAAALFAALPMTADAQLKIGVVDVSRLRDEAPQAKAALQVLEREFAGRKRSLLAEQSALAQLQAQLQRDTGATANAAFNAKRRSDLRTRQRDLQVNSQKYEEDLSRRRSAEIERLQHAIHVEIRTLAREEGFDLILTDAAYHSAQVDVTDRVLQRLKSAGAGQP